MTSPESDREVLEATWHVYDDEFAEYVGNVVTPYDYVDTEEQVNWAARVFMFAYALGSVAGARPPTPDADERETDLDRVEDLVDHVIDIQAGDEVPVSSARIREDFLDGP